VFECTAKRTWKEMSHSLTEHRDVKLEDAGNMFKEPPGSSTRISQIREKERTERNETGCAVTKLHLLLRK
jgi:hypothetical protein